MPLRQYSQALSSQRRGLVELMKDLQFGRLEGLPVRGGEPLISEARRVIREHKFASRPGRERFPEDFVPKDQVVDLFDQLDRLSDGVVETLEFLHGLPFKMSIRHAAR